MKKVFCFVLIFLLTISLMAKDYTDFYQIFPAALAFDLSTTDRRPHTAGWAKGSRKTSPTSGNYFDDDMLGTVGVTYPSATGYYGLMLHIEIEYFAQFRTDKDFSAFRNYGVEVIPRSADHNDIITKAYSDRECTIEIPKSTKYHISDNRNPEVYIPIPLKAGTNQLWADLVIILDSAFEKDSLVIDDNYYGEVKIELYQLNPDKKTINPAYEPISFTLNCSGYYGTGAPDNYQKFNFFVEKNEAADYFPILANSSWTDYTKIGNILFTTNTFNNKTNRTNVGKDYRIVISSTNDLTNPTPKFKFKRVGSVGESQTNTIEYSVAVVPNPITKGSEYDISSVENGKYIQIANSTSSVAYKSNYSLRNTPAIKGDEIESKRQIQVPYYYAARVEKDSADAYVFNYEGEIFIKLEGYNGIDNRNFLQGGLYSSTIYLQVISAL